MTDEVIFWFILIGFIAQIVDGTMGMAYGVISNSAMIAIGMPPAHASANVHAAEMFTTAASGVSHAIAKNVDWSVFWRLAVFGSIGAVAGALIVSLVHTELIRPFIAAYLFCMGIVVIVKGLRPVSSHVQIKRVGVLGLCGGMADTIGGGGWGPVVASSLIAKGGDPGKMVGTVNLAEFFVTVAASISFLAVLGPNFGKAALGLLIGGVIAAPIAAWAVGKFPKKTLTLVVGCAICLISLYNLYRSIF